MSRWPSRRKAPSKGAVSVGHPTGSATGRVLNRQGLGAAQRGVGLARANAYLAQRQLEAAERTLAQAERPPSPKGSRSR
jgi:hypothetical protein